MYGVDMQRATKQHRDNSQLFPASKRYFKQKNLTRHEIPKKPHFHN